MTDGERAIMLKQIWEELQYVRGKLDTHVSEEKQVMSEVRGHISSQMGTLNQNSTYLQNELSEIKGTMKGLVTQEDLIEIRDSVTSHKVKVGVLFSAAGALFLLVFGWIFKQ